MPRRRERQARPSEPHRPPGPGPAWAGTITFGLVSVPIHLYPAHRSAAAGLRMLAPTGTPVARRYVCEQDGREVSGDHIVRGFEIEPGKHVVVTDEELERLAPRKTRAIELKKFVELASLDPMRFERPYFLTPAGDESTKAYRLLAEVMERTGRAGIATFVLHGKERIVAILSEDGIMRGETLRFADEIRSPEDIGLPRPVETDRHRVGAFGKKISAMSKPGLALDELADPQVEAMKKLVARKRRSGERVVAREAGDKEPEAEPVDLVEVLKRSLGRTGRASRGGRPASGRRRRVSARAGSRGRARAS